MAASDYVVAERAESIKITAARNKMTPQMAEYILGLYKFKIDLEDSMVSGSKIEESWLRSKERLKGNPIDWGKIVDRGHFDKAMAIKR